MSLDPELRRFLEALASGGGLHPDYVEEKSRELLDRLDTPGQVE